MPIIALEKQSQEDLYEYEFKASLVYKNKKVPGQPGPVTQRDPVLKNDNNKIKLGVWSTTRGTLLGQLNYL